jgi:imidazolonepropionase-like amidohydrolase
MATIRIEADRLVPGRGEPLDDGVVLLDGPTIRYAGPAADAPSTPSATVTRVPAVMPGMWDGHCHLFGSLSADLTVLYREPVALRAGRATLDLGRALAAGVTSVREAGGLGVDLGRAVAEGSVPGPRVHAAGAILSTTGGHGDLHDLPLGWVHDLTRHEPTFRLCDGIDACTTAVREQLRKGAAIIKVCASGGVLSERDHPIHQQFTLAELRAIVEVAGMAERGVMAHCHGKPGMLAAIEAGVVSIEHGTYLDDEVAAAMVERDVLLVPTRLIVTELLAAGRTAGMSAAVHAKLEATDRIHEEALTRAHEAGVRIAMGTDIILSRPDLPAAWGNHGRELPLLAAAGLSALEVLEAATANGPAALGPQAPRSGQLVAGYDADVIGLTSDPSQDVELLADPTNVTHVWQDGRLVRGPADEAAAR